MTADLHTHPAVHDRIRYDRGAVTWLANMAQCYALAGDELTAASLREHARAKSESVAKLEALVAPIRIPMMPE